MAISQSAKRQRTDDNNAAPSVKPEVLSLGISVLDYIVVVDSYPDEDSKQAARDQMVGGGGNAANTSVTLARLGVGVKLLTKVGPDAAGEQVQAELKQEGVDCSEFVVGEAGEHTVTAVVLVSGSSRTIVSMPHHQRVSELKVEDVKPSMFDGISLLQLDGRHSSAALQAAKLAHERSVPILVEAELRTGARPDDLESSLAKLLAFAEYVVTSEHYPCATTGKSTVEEGLKCMLQSQAPKARWAVATLGSKGCVAVCRSDGSSEKWREIHTPAWPVEVVDTTGAGDSFIGGLAYGIVRGLPLERAFSIASWVAGQKCKRAGCRLGLPTLNDLTVAAQTEPKLQ